jgi:tetratricopeptide (TPR) repeat protein
MKKIFIFIIIETCLLSINDAHAQINSDKQDTVFNFLMDKCFELFKPHAEMNYSFGTEELKNHTPDLSAKIPELKDTVKLVDELKGNYKDWYIFYKIGSIYQRFSLEQNAMNYYNQAYNLIYNEIKKDTLKSAPFSDMGSLYLNLNNTENAFYFYNRAYSLNEKDSAASMFLPMFLIYSGNFKKAEELVRKRLDYDPQNPDMYIWLLTSNIYQKISTINKNDPTILNKSIDEIFDLKDFVDAKNKFKDDIRFSLLNELGRQLSLYAKYIALSDDFKDLNISDIDLKELKNIQKNLQKIIDKKQFKNNYIIYKSLAFNYLLDKNTDKAIEFIKKAMNLWPKDKIANDYYILFSIHYFINNDTIAALNVIDEKIKYNNELHLKNPGDCVLKGNVLLQKQDFIGAEKAYNDALQIEQNSNAYLGLSIKHIWDKNFTEANKYINKAYDLDKEYYLTYALFGMITLMNNQNDESKTALEKALQLKPDEAVIKNIYEAFFKN